MKRGASLAESFDMPAHPSEFDEPMLRRLEEEMDAYTQWMKERAEEVYMIAERASVARVGSTRTSSRSHASDSPVERRSSLVEHLEGMGGGLIDPRRSR